MYVAVVLVNAWLSLAWYARMRCPYRKRIGAPFEKNPHRSWIGGREVDCDVTSTGCPNQAIDCTQAGMVDEPQLVGDGSILGKKETGYDALFS